MNDVEPTVLTVAGSDPTGGAGIQADIKTMTTIGIYAAAAVSCVTVQNSYGVSRIVPLTPDVVSAQIHAVLNDHNVTHVKIGMVGTIAVAEAIGAALDYFTGEVIFDPVLMSSTGQDFFDPQAIQELHEILVNRVTVLTPNLPELFLLVDEREPVTHHNAVKAAKKLLMRHEKLRVVLVKGGHTRTGEIITDTIVFKRAGRLKEKFVSHLRISSNNTHGTGCTLASAYAAYHCQTDDDISSFFSAVEYVQRILAASSPAVTVKNPDGQGVMLHYRLFPSGS